METVDYERDGEVALVALARPDRLNAVNPQLVEDLCAALERATRDGVGAAVLAGRGRAFCAGHDLRHAEPAVTEAEQRRRLERIQDVTRSIRQAPYPIVTAVQGYALGAGCEFALAADLVVAAEDAIFGFPEVEVGLSVTGGISHLLPLALGVAKAKQLVLLGERFAAADGLRWGLVNWVVPERDLMAKALEVAGELAGRPRHAMALAKACLDRGPQVDLETALELEIASALTTRQSPEAQQAAEAFRARARADQDGP
jgi:2-(1,2-epoxy-1,2-dihydrophenyl)acetyl-CoA isomerase